MALNAALRPTCRKIFSSLDRRHVACYNTACFETFFQLYRLWHAYGFTANLLPDYLTCVCKNFVMALPLQLIVVGPIARKTFRTVFHVKAV